MVLNLTWGYYSKLFLNKSNDLISGAGTDANVFLIIFGEGGLVTPKLKLEKSLNNNEPFERNKMDHFQVETVNVGKIAKINISHDGTGTLFVVNKIKQLL